MTAEEIERTEETNALPLWYYVDGGLLIALILSLITYYTVRYIPTVADSVALSFSAPVRDFMGRVTSLFTFSVMEIFYVFGILFVLFHIVYSIIRIKRASNKQREANRRILILAILAAFLWSGYCWLWGIAYCGRTFSEKAGLNARAQITAEELYNVTAKFLVAANKLSEEVERDDDGLFCADIDDIFDSSVDVYDNIFKEFPFLEGECRRPKKMVFSELMSYMGFTGIYFPYLGESSIDVTVTRAMIPATVAHELAHQLGVSNENECNFLGVASSLSSGNTNYMYSGCLHALVYLMNALYSTNHDAWRYLRDNFAPDFEKDWLANNTYWEEHETFLDKMFAGIYDRMLKGSGLALGIRSYDACVTLLVEYYK